MKEFDIFLNKRLTECDVIVSAIPYRDGLTIVDRIILECCLESYYLQKFIAVQAGSELVAHIDDMIKTCYEKLESGIEMGAEAEMNVTAYLQPMNTSLKILAEPIALSAETFERAASAVEIAAEPFKLTVKKYLGRGYSDMELDAKLRDTLKRAMERLEVGASIDAAVEGTAGHDFEQAVAGIETEAGLKDLLYRAWLTDEQILETAVALQAEAAAILRRKRKLAEVDPLTIADMDGKTIDWLDYIVLEE